MKAEEIEQKVMLEYERVNSFNRQLDYLAKRKEHQRVEDIVWYWAKPNKQLANETMDLIGKW